MAGRIVIVTIVATTIVVATRSHCPAGSWSADVTRSAISRDAPSTALPISRSNSEKRIVLRSTAFTKRPPNTADHL